MAKKNRSTQVKREREFKKRERQRKKAEKAAQKRERRFTQDDPTHLESQDPLNDTTEANRE